MSAVTHTEWMTQALALARRGEGLTRPNPPVGAVVVQDGACVGKGWHRKAGGPHAEIYALRQAGDRARGGTIYITLEPCSTKGQTPPCTEAIIAHGIATVVVATTDPNPPHAGRGLRILKQHGIEVICGVCEDEGVRLIAPFRCWVLKQRPYVTLKLGTTLDGKIADRRGRSRWITGARARDEVQALRRRVDVVCVGAGTVRLDNPSLWPRPAKQRQPFRLIVDVHGRTPPAAAVYTDEHAAHTIVGLGQGVSGKRRSSYAKKGAEIVSVPADPQAAVRRLCKEMARRGALHMLCEGGGGLAASLMAAACVDEYVFIVSPKLMGGDNSVSAVRGTGRLMNNLHLLTFVEQRMVGDDLLIRAVPREGKG